MQRIVKSSVMWYTNATGWSTITEIIVRGEAEDNYLICYRTSTCGIRVLNYANFNNMCNFQLFCILEGLDTFSITFNSLPLD